MRKFEVGDRVRVNCLISIHHGQETSVIGPLQRQEPCLEPPFWFMGYTVDIPSVTIGGGVLCAFQPEELIPIYDGNEKASWCDCAWKPKELGMKVWYGDHPRAKVTP